MPTAAGEADELDEMDPIPEDGGGESWLAAAIPTDAPYCSCTRTRVRSRCRLQLQWLHLSADRLCPRRFVDGPADGALTLQLHPPRCHIGVWCPAHLPAKNSPCSK